MAMFARARASLEGAPPTMQMSKAPAVTGEWECTECGYIIEGTEAKPPAHCPECDAPSDALEFVPNDDDVEDDWVEDDDEERDALDDEDYEDDDDDYDEDLDDDEDDDEFDDEDDY
jgi:hypothetical protein